MAILHRATLTPTKLELVLPWLDHQPWGGAGEPELIGSYRFDDPEGEVGVEALLIRRGDAVLHVPLTYRAAPIEGADEHLIGTLHHSVLGERWVYEAAGDPVGRGCYARALAGQQEQAVFEVYDGDAMVEVRDPTIRLALESDPADDPDVRLANVVGDITGAQRLVARWDGGSGVVAAAGPAAAYVHTTSPIGLTVDVTNVAEALEALDEPEART